MTILQWALITTVILLAVGYVSEQEFLSETDPDFFKQPVNEVHRVVSSVRG